MTTSSTISTLSRIHINKVSLLTLLLLLIGSYLTSAQTTQRTSPQFEPLKQSDFLRAQALVKWLVNNRTENGTRTFNAGFIRLAFHDCVGGCDGCLNLRNPSNTGLSFYKQPLDLLYKQFIFPIMSRADWYALAGFTAVEYASQLTPCTGRVCVPPMSFKWGRKDCLNETRLFRRFPGPNNDPRDTIRRTFRMNLLEITALMGAHTLGKHHANGATWVKNETNFDNQYYIDMVNSSLSWRKGVRQGRGSNTWSHGDTGDNIMLTSDFFMGFDVGTRFSDCNNNPIMSCKQSNTFSSVQRFAVDNDYWLTQFGAAFSVMLNNGNFGKLKPVVWDTFNDTFVGELFTPREETTTETVVPVTTTGSLVAEPETPQVIQSISTKSTTLPTSIKDLVSSASGAFAVHNPAANSAGSLSVTSPTTPSSVTGPPNILPIRTSSTFGHTQPTTAAPSPTTVPPLPTTAVPSPTIAVPSPTTAVPSPTTAVPSPTTAAPSPTTAVPSPTTAAPSPTTAVPSPTTAAPSPTTAVPSPTTAVPSPTTAVHSPTTAVPSPTTAIPSPTTAAPSPITAAPSPTTAAPSSITAAPSPTTAVPAPTTAAPSSITAAPSPITAVPTPTTAAPSPITAAPSPTTAAPSPTTAAPSPTIAAPAPTTAASSSITAAPSPTTAVPAPTTVADNTVVDNSVRNTIKDQTPSATFVQSPPQLIVENSEGGSDARVGYSPNKALISQNRIRQLLKIRRRMLNLRRNRERNRGAVPNSDSSD